MQYIVKSNMIVIHDTKKTSDKTYHSVEYNMYKF